MSRAWASGSTREWRAIRAAVLATNMAEHGGRCMLAYPGTWRTRGGVRSCTGIAEEVHHVLGKAMGDDPATLVATCRWCNLRAGEPGKADEPTPVPRTAWVL